MEIIEQIIGALFIGFIGGAFPGPILTSVFTEALRKGFLMSLRVVLKAIVAESILALFILSAFSSLNIPPAFPYAISLAGSLVLVWLAFKVWKIKEIGGEGEIFAFWKIFILMLTNGAFWIYWIAVCVPQAFLLKDEVSGGQFIFLAVFLTGWFFGTTAMVFIFSRFKKIIVAKKLVAPAFKFFALLLFGFAAKMAFEAVIYLANAL